MNLRQPDPGGILRGAAKSVIRIVSDTESRKLSPFRDAPQDVRDHSDIPLSELASLATAFLAKGHTTEKTAELMSRRIGLKRVSGSTRARFEAAAQFAESCRTDQ